MTTDPHEWSDTAAYREEDDFQRMMSGDDRDWLAAFMALGAILAVIGCVTGLSVFLLISAAAFWPWVAAFLLSGWGIGLSALSVTSMVLTVVLLDRAQEGR